MYKLPNSHMKYLGQAGAFGIFLALTSPASALVCDLGDIGSTCVINDHQDVSGDIDVTGNLTVVNGGRLKFTTNGSLTVGGDLVIEEGGEIASNGPNGPDGGSGVNGFDITINVDGDAHVNGEITTHGGNGGKGAKGNNATSPTAGTAGGNGGNGGSFLLEAFNIHITGPGTLTTRGGNGGGGGDGGDQTGSTGNGAAGGSGGNGGNAGTLTIIACGDFEADDVGEYEITARGGNGAKGGMGGKNKPNGSGTATNGANGIGGAGSTLDISVVGDVLMGEGQAHAQGGNNFGGGSGTGTDGTINISTNAVDDTNSAIYDVSMADFDPEPITENFNAGVTCNVCP